MPIYQQGGFSPSRLILQKIANEQNIESLGLFNSSNLWENEYTLATELTDTLQSFFTERYDNEEKAIEVAPLPIIATEESQRSQTTYHYDVEKNILYLNIWDENGIIEAATNNNVSGAINALKAYIDACRAAERG